MTNKAFYRFCRDQRKVESDPDRRAALTSVYNFMRECGVTKAGVAGFLNHCKQECAKKGSSTAGYEWVEQQFASAGPALFDTGWTDEEMTRLAEITPADLASAGALWDDNAPAELKGLLDGGTI